MKDCFEEAERLRKMVQGDEHTLRADGSVYDGLVSLWSR
jgi:hypothetical protein